MFANLVILFVIVPIADLTLLLFLSSKIGWQTSIAMVIASGVIGAWLLRRSYRSILHSLSQPMTRAELPLELLSDGAMIFLGAGLLLTPGFFTDLIGISFLVPACRRRYRKWFSAWFKTRGKFEFSHFSTRMPGFDSPDSEDVVEGSVEPARDRDPVSRIQR